MINKVATFEDSKIEMQIDEIISHQSKNDKEITITFSGAEEQKADVGFYADRFRVVDRDSDIRIWRTNSDDRYMYLQSNGAGTVTIQVYKSK